MGAVEHFDFAVGLGPVRSGVLDARPQNLGEGAETEASTVVREHAQHKPEPVRPQP